MPRADPLPLRRQRLSDILTRLGKTFGNRRRDKDRDDGGVPVKPDRPNTLSGGAAAPLEFDE